MRIVTRMTGTTALTGLLFFSAYGVWLVVKERRDLRTSAEMEIGVLATSLRVGVENALRDRQIEDVNETTLRLEGLDPWMDVWVFDTTAKVVSAPGGVPSGDLGRELGRLSEETRESLETRIAWVPETHPRDLLLVTPLRDDDGDYMGSLGVRRPLDKMNRDLLATTGAVVLTTGGFVLVASVLGLLVGQARLGRPLERLAAAMRSLRDVRTEGFVPEDGDDEPAALAREFNQMLVQLRDARVRADVEADARRSAVSMLHAADRLVTVGQLSASVAHEIGSPLQVLLGRARSLAATPDDPVRTRRHAEVMVRETERIAHIVDNLLSITRKRSRERKIMNPVEAIRRVLDLLELEANRRRISLRFQPSLVPDLFANADQMEQVVLNLVTNALAATKPGGTVTVGIERNDGKLALYVEDDGEGMIDEVRQCCFEPLFTTRADQGGTGLGLTVVKAIVEDHGGSVECTSRVGRGSRFVAFFPLPGTST